MRGGLDPLRGPRRAEAGERGLVFKGVELFWEAEETAWRMAHGALELDATNPHVAAPSSL